MRRCARGRSVSGSAAGQVAVRAGLQAGSVSLGLLVSFAGLFGFMFGALALLRRLDQAWILVRRAAGHDQRSGALGRIFAITAVVCALAFVFWFLVIHGPGGEFSGAGNGGTG